MLCHIAGLKRLGVIYRILEERENKRANGRCDIGYAKNERRLILLWIQGQFIQYMKMEKIFIFTQNMLVVLVIHLRRLIT